MSTANSIASIFTGQTAAGAASQSSTASKETGKTEFLKLLVTQLKHQDPMNPINNEQFLTQLATFSSLEQLIAINSAVTKLAVDSQQ